ncbi:signal peptidase II, partial [bacterium]|nr:signal peptidase II [bacterium]
MKKKYKYLIVIAPLVFILDQLTKFFIIESVPMNTGFAVIPGFFDIVHVTNKGAAFGMFSQSASALREPFFNIVAVVALIFITVY